MKIFNVEYKTFFFDFDGVLADSVEVKTNAFATLFEKFGPEIKAQVIEHHRKNGGMPREDKFVYYYQNYLKKPLNNVELDQLCLKFSELVVENVIEAPEISGAQGFLKKCYDEVSCFLLSATPDEELRIIARRRDIDHYFKEILGSSCSKTHHVTTLIAKYNLNPKQCMFWGDAGNDYRAAVESGVDFIGILPNINAPLLKIAPDIQWYKNFLEIEALRE